MSAPIETIRRIKNDFLTCGICLENLHKPKNLTCLHKFCETCLSVYINSLGVTPGRKFECPFRCRDKTVLPSKGVEGLKTDYTLQSLIEYLQTREKEEITRIKISSAQRPKGKPPAPPPPKQVEPNNDDLENLYSALWKSSSKTEATSSAPLYPNLEGIFETASSAPPTVHQRKESAPTIVPPSIPPKQNIHAPIVRSASAEPSPEEPLYTELWKTSSLNKNTAQSFVTPSAPVYTSLQAQQTVPPAYNPYLTNGNISRLNNPGGNHDTTEHTNNNKLMEQMKQAFRIDLNKNPASLNPEEMCYSDMMTLAKERSLQEKTASKSEELARFHPDGMDEQQAFQMALDESRIYQARAYRTGLEAADDSIMYSLGKEMSVAERRKESAFISVSIDDIENQAYIDQLSTNQLLDILHKNNVMYTRTSDRAELTSEVKRLWRAKQYQIRPLPDVPDNMYDNNISDDTQREMLSLTRRRSPDPSDRPIRSARNMKLPSIPVEDDASNQRTGFTGDSRSPTISSRSPIQGRPLPELPDHPAPPGPTVSVNDILTVRRNLSSSRARPQHETPSADEVTHDYLEVLPESTSSNRRRSPETAAYTVPSNSLRRTGSSDAEKTNTESATPITDFVSSMADVIRQTSLKNKKTNTNDQTICFDCNELIPTGSRHTIIKGKPYHIDCFRCRTCDVSIDGGGYCDEPNFPTCRPCNLKATNKCSECNQTVNINISMKWNGKHYHKPCFVCIKCQKELQYEKVYKKSGDPCCGDCFKSEYAKSCVRCKKPIMGTCNKISGNRTYHPQCLTCKKCGSELKGLRIFSKGTDDNIYCNSCYN